MAQRTNTEEQGFGARLAQLHNEAGYTQQELAKLLGVKIEQILEGDLPETRRAGPVGKAQKIFEKVSTLPRKQQERIVETVSAVVERYKRRA